MYQALGRERVLSARTIRQVHAILRGSFGQAVWWGWIRSNPAASASPPPVRKADVHPPTPEIAVRLVAEAEAWDAEYAVFRRLAAATGGRHGELRALRWTDVEAGTLATDSQSVSRRATLADMTRFDDDARGQHRRP